MGGLNPHVHGAASIRLICTYATAQKYIYQSSKGKMCEKITRSEYRNLNFKTSRFINVFT